MPPSLPHVSGAETVRALQKLGFIVLGEFNSEVRQKGGRVIVRRDPVGRVVPQHR